MGVYIYLSALHWSSLGFFGVRFLIFLRFGLLVLFRGLAATRLFEHFGANLFSSFFLAFLQHLLTLPSFMPAFFFLCFYDGNYVGVLVKRYL